MNCKKCGKEVEQDWSTCPYCGFSLGEDGEKVENEKPKGKEKSKKKGKLKKILIFLLIVLVGLAILGGEDDGEDVDADKTSNTEIDVEEENMTEDNDNQDIEFSYDFDTDVQRGLLYANAEGLITDVNGRKIEEYDWVRVLEGQIVWHGEDVMDMYSTDENGQIIYYTSEAKTPLERLKAKASQEGCTTDIVVNENWLGTEFEEIAYDIADDGNYFDEVVLGAWFDENGTPIATGLPGDLSWAISEKKIDYNYNVSSLVEDFHFINGEDFTMDMLKRTSPNETAVYALVLTNIMKGTDANGKVFFQGWDFISSTPVIVHGDFSGILNGDNLLVFAAFTGLASDDSPNFVGLYIENINDRNITSLE